MIANIEIEDALVAQLETAAKSRGLSFRAYLTEVLTKAANSPAPLTALQPYVMKTHDFGAHIESPWTLVVDLESDEYLRRLAKK